jgi:hypothetical protein
MTDPSEKDLLDALNEIDQYYGIDWEWGWVLDAIRRLIVTVGEWKEGAREAIEEVYTGVGSADRDELYLLLETIRDFGEKGK